MRHNIKPTQQPEIYNDIVENGYCEFLNSYLTKNHYQKIYTCLDNLNKLFSKDPSFAQFIMDIEKEFSNIYGTIFCGAPAGYRDCTQKIGKKDQKIYFQFSSEYYSLIKEKYKSTLNKYSFFKIFLDYLEKVDSKSRLILNKAIDSLGKNVPNLKPALLGNRKDLTIVIKILRYEGNGNPCTSPHYDKSGLTLILDNSDIAADRFILGPFAEQFSTDRLFVPKRHYTSKKYKSSLLFPGACLREVNIPLNPTPHAVLPAESEFRYAIIAFCLVPNIETSNVQTTITDKNELLTNVCTTYGL